MWGGNAAVIVGFLVLMPHADEGWQMLMALQDPPRNEQLPDLRRSRDDALAGSIQIEWPAVAISFASDFPGA